MSIESLPSRRPYPGKYLFSHELPPSNDTHIEPKRAWAAFVNAATGPESELAFALSLQQNILSPNDILLLHAANTGGRRGIIKSGEIIWTLGGNQPEHNRQPGLQVFDDKKKRDSLLVDMAYLQMPHEFFSFDRSKHGSWAEYRTRGETGSRVIANALWLINQIDDPKTAETAKNSIRSALERRANYSPTELSRIDTEGEQFISDGQDPNVIMSGYEVDLRVFDFMTRLLSGNPEAEDLLKRERIMVSLGGPSPFFECATIYAKLETDVENTDMEELHQTYIDNLIIR